MERLGRGTEFIATASRRIGAAAPTWKDAPTGVVLTMFSAHRTLELQDLNSRQRSLLDALKQGEALPLREYLARFAASITDRHARRDLDELVKGGFLVVEGRGSTTVYRRKR
jgi:predicted HTH transcriptional regulator